MSAQKDVKGTTEFGINLGYDFGLQSGGGGFFSLQPEFGKHFSNQLYLGVGTGAYVDDKFNSVSIPAFVRAQVDFPMKGITPMFRCREATTSSQVAKEQAGDVSILLSV